MLDYFQILVKLIWVILKLEVHMRRMLLIQRMTSPGEVISPSEVETRVLETN